MRTAGRVLPCLAVSLAACAGPSGALRKQVNAKISTADYAGAAAAIEGAKMSSYGKKNMVLYYLDLGAVQHDGRLYNESDKSLAVAEQRMDELYTKSVSKESAALLINDNTVDYAGARFERALLNVYRALDSLFSDDRENALVEIRKLSRLLQEYADTAGSRAYKNDPFAQYLSGLLYADGGQADDARIAFEASGLVLPETAEAPGGEPGGELVFIHANGVAPRKESRSFQIAWNEAAAAVNDAGGDDAQATQARNALRAGILGSAITVSYPVYVQDPFNIVASELEVSSRTASTQLVEDVSSIARTDLEERQAMVKTRAVARAAIKYILSKIATDSVKRKYGEKSFQAVGTQIFTSVAAAASEVADTRAWATLPAQFRLARLSLPPGKQQVTVRYKDASGKVLLSRDFTVDIRQGSRTYLHDRTAL